MTVKPSVSLTDEQYGFARSLVDSGRCATLSAVLQQGLDLLRQKMEAEEADAVALRRLLALRAGGPFVAAADMAEAVEAMIAEKRVAHGPGG